LKEIIDDEQQEEQQEEKQQEQQQRQQEQQQEQQQQRQQQQRQQEQQQEQQQQEQQQQQEEDVYTIVHRNTEDVKVNNKQAAENIEKFRTTKRQCAVNHIEKKNNAVAVSVIKEERPHGNAKKPLGRPKKIQQTPTLEQLLQEAAQIQRNIEAIRFNAVTSSNDEYELF